MKGEVNSAFFFETYFENSRHTHYGRFLCVDRNRRPELTWVTAATKGAEMVVTVDLMPSKDGSLLRLNMQAFLMRSRRIATRKLGLGY
jgi:hypothetical protein